MVTATVCNTVIEGSSPSQISNGSVAKLVYASDLKSDGKPCQFDSDQSHQYLLLIPMYVNRQTATLRMLNMKVQLLPWVQMESKFRRSETRLLSVVYLTGYLCRQQCSPPLCICNSVVEYLTFNQRVECSSHSRCTK